MATTTTQAKKHLLSVRRSVLNTVQIFRILPPCARSPRLCRCKNTGNTIISVYIIQNSFPDLFTQYRPSAQIPPPRSPLPYSFLCSSAIFALSRSCHREPVTDVTSVAIRSPIIYSSPAKKLLTTSPRRAITIPTYRVGSLLPKSEATPMTYLPPLPLTGRC